MSKLVLKLKQDLRALYYTHEVVHCIIPKDGVKSSLPHFISMEMTNKILSSTFFLFGELSEGLLIMYSLQAK
jgi:hypothetical protein